MTWAIAVAFSGAMENEFWEICPFAGLPSVCVWGGGGYVHTDELFTVASFLSSNCLGPREPNRQQG